MNFWIEKIMARKSIFRKARRYLCEKELERLVTPFCRDTRLFMLILLLQNRVHPSKIKNIRRVS